MRFFTAAMFLLAGVSLGADTEPHCKSATSTATVCNSTCRQLACLAFETITLFSDCPSPVPTTTTAYACAETKCPGGYQSTSYKFVSPPARVTEAPRAFNSALQINRHG